jgi:hypothetical protein
MLPTGRPYFTGILETTCEVVREIDVKVELWPPLGALSVTH